MEEGAEVVYKVGRALENGVPGLRSHGVAPGLIYPRDTRIEAPDNQWIFVFLSEFRARDYARTLDGHVQVWMGEASSITEAPMLIPASAALPFWQTFWHTFHAGETWELPARYPFVRVAQIPGTWLVPDLTLRYCLWDNRRF